jgi:hypothetical protein
MIERRACPFCAAAAGSATTPVVYESEKALALTLLRPATHGHTLVIPRAHVPDLCALDPAEAPALTEAVLRVAHAVRRALDPDGLKVITSAGGFRASAIGVIAEIAMVKAVSLAGFAVYVDGAGSSRALLVQRNRGIDWNGNCTASAVQRITEKGQNA